MKHPLFIVTPMIWLLYSLLIWFHWWLNFRLFPDWCTSKCINHTVDCSSSFETLFTTLIEETLGLLIQLQLFAVILQVIVWVVHGIVTSFCRHCMMASLKSQQNGSEGKTDSFTEEKVEAMFREFDADK